MHNSIQYRDHQQNSKALVFLLNLSPWVFGKQYKIENFFLTLAPLVVTITSLFAWEFNPKSFWKWVEVLCWIKENKEKSTKH